MTSNNFFSKLKFKRLTAKRNKPNSGTSYDITPLEGEEEPDKQVTLKRYLKLSSADYLGVDCGELQCGSADHSFDANTDARSLTTVPGDKTGTDEPQSNGRKDSSSRDRWSTPPLLLVDCDDKITSMVHSVNLQAPLARPESDTINVAEADPDEHRLLVDSMSPDDINNGDQIEVDPGYQTIDEVKKRIARLKHPNGVLVGKDMKSSSPSCSHCLTSVAMVTDIDAGASDSVDHKDIRKFCLCTSEKNTNDMQQNSVIKDSLCYADSGVDSPGILSSSPQSQSTYSRYDSNNSSVLSEAEFALTNTTATTVIGSTNGIEALEKRESKQHDDHNSIDKDKLCDMYNARDSNHGNCRPASCEWKRNIEELYAVPNKRKVRDISSSVNVDNEHDDEEDKLSIAAGPVPLQLNLENGLSTDGIEDEPPPLPDRAYGSLPSSPITPHSVSLAEHSSNPELWKASNMSKIAFSYEENIPSLPPSTGTETIRPQSNPEGENRREEWVYENARTKRSQANSLEGSGQAEWLYNDDSSSDSRTLLSRSVPDIQRRKLPSPPRGHKRSCSSGKSDMGNDEPKCVDFFESLRMLKECGWYWGPLSWDDAEAKLANKPDGSFLVRDSSDERYILSLSFTSQGSTHHTRIEHHKGLFSFYSQPHSHGCGTIVDFIERAMAHSRNGKFLYFLRPRAQGYPPVPLQLLQAISRFQTMRSLQHMCRFVILKYVRKDHIGRLPLPSRTKDYLMESQYYAENIEDDGESTDSTLTES